MSDQVEWRPVPGYPDYSVSNTGLVVSHKRRGGPRLLSQGVSHNGYRTVHLSDAGVDKNFKVHRLVALAFIGPRPDGAECRHLDGDKSNNSAVNLAYGSRSQNIRDQVEHGVHNNARKTECSQQHSLTDEDNLYRWRGRRKCRTCLRERKQAHTLAAANIRMVGAA